MTINEISNKQVTKAGQYFVDNIKVGYDQESHQFNKSVQAVQYWRQVHQEALEPAFSKLEVLARGIDKDATCAKRLKRLTTIIMKLYRFRVNKMALRNMQDVGGCRAIISSNKKLKQLIRKIRKEPEFKINNKIIRIDDYIKHPKEDGYRCFHIVGLYPDKNNVKRKIEIQLRSTFQHSWATAVEITDLFNKQSLKNNDGDSEWAQYYLLCSKVFEYIENIYNFENIKEDNLRLIIKNEILKDAAVGEIFNNIKVLYKKLKVSNKLSGFMASIKSANEEIHTQEDISGYVLFKINTTTFVTSKRFYKEEENELANSEYSISENLADDNTFVSLIYTRNLTDLKYAYPNYYADSTLFLQLMNFVIKI